jgi:predicted CopG family antitoxin
MPATTIKIESDLVKKVTGLKAKDESISGYVRELIEREYRARHHRQAAAAYQQFLQQHPEEKAAIEVWESAPLVQEPESPKP